MRSRNKCGCLVACLLAAGLTALHAFAQAGTQPANGDTKKSTVNSFGAQIAETLQIHDSDINVLPLLADAISTVNSDDKTKGTAISKLVDGLLAGPHSDQLLNQILPTVHVGSGNGVQVDIPGWKYGSYYQRSDLVRALWELAQAAQEKDPKRASEIARASAMLAAINDFQLGWTHLQRIVKDPGAKKLMALTDADFARLQQIVKDRSDQNSIYMDEVELAMKAMDEIIGQKDQLDLGKLNSVTAHLDKAFRQGVIQEGSRWWLIDQAWAMMNLLREKKSEDGQIVLTKFLESWRKDFSSTQIDRWITESLTVKGTAPVKMLEEVTMQPDGTFAPKK